MSEPFLGEIKLVSWNYPPRGWAFCDGATLPISTNNALFALLGTTFGGDGRTTFKLPDLRSRIPIGPSGGGPFGVTAGEETHTLSVAETPPHTHTVQATAATNGTGPLAADSWLGGVTNGYGQNPGPGTSQTNLAPGDITTAGSSMPHENRQPYLCVNFAIALSGIFPSRP